MDSQKLEEEMEGGLPIYYMNIRIAYWKKKYRHEINTWAVSIHTDPVDITKKDVITMRRLYNDVYNGSKAKDKKVVVIKIHDKKIVGHQNKRQSDCNNTGEHI